MNDTCHFHPRELREYGLEKTAAYTQGKNRIVGAAVDELSREPQLPNSNNSFSRLLIEQFKHSIVPCRFFSFFICCFEVELA